MWWSRNLLCFFIWMQKLISVCSMSLDGVCLYFMDVFVFSCCFTDYVGNNLGKSLSVMVCKKHPASQIKSVKDTLGCVTVKIYPGLKTLSCYLKTIN